MPSNHDTLQDLGWDAHFDDQLSVEERETAYPVRVMAVHRGKIAVVRGSAAGDAIVGEGPESGFLSPYIPGAKPGEDHPTVGDWLLVKRDSHEPIRVLARKNLFKRRAPGDPRQEQMIAANVDTAFIVASCNQDFSVARLERYLVLAREAGVAAVVVLTKADLTDTPEDYVAAVRGIDPDVVVETLDARDRAAAGGLAAYCGPGHTVAFLGSSGVGKSTLVNTLRGSDSIATQAIRAHDGTGRHTTTVREMHRLGHGGWLLDLPGMRALQLSEAASGIAEVFDDVALAAENCRFSNCAHGTEPGCAVRAEIAAGAFTEARFERWRTLVAGDGAKTALSRGRRSR